MTLLSLCHRACVSLRSQRLVQSRLSRALSSPASSNNDNNSDDEETASFQKLRDLAQNPLSRSLLILDVRDASEVASGKGGPPSAIKGAVNVPLNIDNVGQRLRETTKEEFLQKLADAGVDLHGDRDTDADDAESEREIHIVTHCGSGGRGGRAQRLLKEAGFKNAINGRGPKFLARAGFEGVEAI